MEGDDKLGALRLLLKERCSGSDFSDEDLKNLVDAGYETEADLKAVTMEALNSTLPRRYGKVDVLLKQFGTTQITMKTTIWLRGAEQTWLELATDAKGTLSISRIAARTNLSPETLVLGPETLGAYEGITIEEVRGVCGSTAGQSKELAVLVGGIAKPAAHSEARQVTPEQDDRFEKTIETMGEMKMQLAGILAAVASKKPIRISDASSTVWRNVQSSAGVKIENNIDLFDATKHTERIVPQFDWGESTESAQAVEYVNYIEWELVKSNRNWSVINGNKHPNLLDNDLWGMMFEGTVDVAVVVKAAHTIPETGLKIIFEVRKVGKINKKAEYQTMVSLLLANVVSGDYRPVAMLSDLGDKWIFFWMDDTTVLRHEFATRSSKAVGFLDAILEGDVEPEDHSHDIAALRITGESSSRGVQRSFSGRQEIWTPEMERLEELAGFLPEDELRQGRAAIALRYAMNTPAFSSVFADMRESSEPFFEGMHT